MTQYDLIVIGGGPGGTRAAAIAASQGLSVALVEADKIGGTCLNRGCIPTKCLCAAAEMILNIHNSSEFGLEYTLFGANYTVSRRRAEAIVDSLRTDLTDSLGKVNILKGRAVLGEGRTVVADNCFMKARRIIIATGSKPAPFPAEGGEYVIDSDQFIQLDELPPSLIIVGGGVIGLEFASIAAAFGCDVKVLEFSKEILPGIDAEVAKRLRSYLTRRGISITVGAEVKKVSKSSNGLVVTYLHKGKELEIEAHTVLSATGRRPVLPEGIEAAGIKLNDRGFIATDDHYATTAEGIYAIGDVNGKLMLAHAAEAQARVALEVTDTLGVVPSVVFTVPECATVGATAGSDEDNDSIKVPYTANSKALASGHTDGFVKLAYRRSDRVIIGCQIVGAHAADLISEAAILIDAHYTVDRLAYNTVSAHPGLSELLQEAAARAAK